MKTLAFKDVAEFDEYFFGPKKESYEIYTVMLDCLTRAIDEDLESVQFFHISFKNGSEAGINCDKNEYVGNLKAILNYFEEIEEFEKCKFVQKLIQRIN